MAASSLPRNRVYDVFLSFRGEDTRTTIVSHLYHALVGRGIVTFKDDRRLEVGDLVSEELCIAIKGSRIAIVVLSENYATSRWCLMELHLIMKLMRKKRIVVIPVFYGVVPTVVRHQRGNFSLDMYQGQEMEDRVLRWREDLKLIANTSGVVSSDCADEATMVEQVVRNILRRVTLMHKIDSETFVGVKDLINDGLINLLDLQSLEVICLGILGMGGIGKTTIAKCLFDQLSPEFEACCFIENICKDKIHDLVHFQKKLLSDLLHNRDDISLWSVEAGCQQIKERLKNKKVLLVLDGVDKVAQVQALAEDTSWFGPGSRIIITTRDKGLLNRCRVKEIYEVKCLDEKDSLQLFKQIAFRGESPPEGFEQLLVRASRLAHGLPSAIQAHALFLCGRADSPAEWEQAVCGLEDCLDENIVEILKISYDGLTPPQQNVFCHVACLFNGENMQRVVSLLDGSKATSSTWIRDLADKSLIKISTNRCVIMHKLVEQMGREIMHDCRKFLEDPEEIRDALAARQGTEETECMSLHTCEMTRPLFLTTSSVLGMRNLKFLKVYKHLHGDKESTLQVIPDLNYLPYNLRLFHWDAFPQSSLATWRYFERLVELNLRNSNLDTLWNEKLVFENLKRLDLTGSMYLTQLPYLSRFEALEELILEHCPRLEGFPQFIRNHSKLKKLKLSYGDQNKTPLHVEVEENPPFITLRFPDGTVVMDGLIDLSIQGDITFVFKLFLFGYDVDYLSLTSEHQISATSTTHVQHAPLLPSVFNKFNSLIAMRINYKEISRPYRIYGFPDFPNLKELKLINLNIHDVPDDIHCLEFLEKLDLSGNDFERLPEDMNSLSSLKTLWLRNCFYLKELPKLTQVHTLTLSNCRNLTSLLKLSDIRELGSYCLLELCLENCNSVEPLSDQLKYLTKLTYLDLSSHDFEALPSSISNLTSLVSLCLNNCKNLISLEELPLSLRFLDADGCDSLDADSVKQFKDTLNKEVQLRNDCFQETEMPSSALYHHRATRSRQSIRLPKITPTLLFVGISIFIMLVAVLVNLILRAFE